MENIIDIQEKKAYRYSQKECNVIKNGVFRSYNFIVLYNDKTEDLIISDFTKFFLHKDRLNNSINTNKNNYGTILILFLNYIFFDRKQTLKNIEDIDIDIGNEFLNKFVYGYLNKREKYKKLTVKSDDVIERSEMALSVFYKWLFYNKEYKMKFLKKADFKFFTRINYSKRGKKNGVERQHLVSLFTVEYPHKQTSIKIKTPDELMIYTLINIAKQYDPMLTFAIALQSFAGLRRGEVCQMCIGRISNNQFGKIITSFSINLNEEYMLREDGVRTGNIKKHRIQETYWGFLPYMAILYNEHMELLRTKGFSKDYYGALFLGKNGKALTTDQYAIRFSKLIQKLIDRLWYMSKNGDIEAATDYEMLMTAKMTPHSLRYFFTEYIAKREPTHILAAFRGDSNINTSLNYLHKSREKVEYIKKIQDSFAVNYKKITGKEFK